MEPNNHQPHSLDSSKPLAPDRPDGAPAGMASEVTAAASQYAQDWQYAQKALVGRWSALTSEDFAAADGDRERFVERLASRSGISQFEASNDLTAFEAHQPVHWRRRVPTARAK